MNDIIFITENINPPIDEGTKKYAFKLAAYIKRNELGDIYTTSSNNDYFSLPKNKFLFSIKLLKRIREKKYKKLIYLPITSLTFASILRMFFLIKYVGDDCETCIISIQKRIVPKVKTAMMKKLKIDRMVVFSKEEERLYKSVNCKIVRGCGGINTSKYKPISDDDKTELKKKLGFEVDAKILLHVGHIKEGRNIEVLAELQDEGYQIVIIGSTSTDIDINLKKQLEDKGVKVFIDFYEDVQQFYQISDVYVFTVVDSQNAIELPLSVIEALSCGIPVVTTPFGGLPDIFNRKLEYLSFWETNEQLLLLINQMYIKIINRIELNKEISKRFSWENVLKPIVEA